MPCLSPPPAEIGYPVGVRRIVTAEEMRCAEREAGLQGCSEWRLMHQAGLRAAESIANLCISPQHPPLVPQSDVHSHVVYVVCGPGNNGGDGYVVAARLQRLGWNVGVVPVLHDPQEGIHELSKPAHYARRYWLEQNPLGATKEKPVHASLEHAKWPKRGTLWVIDALFGTGLNRDLDASAVDIIAAMNVQRERGARLVALDLPSGVSSDTGEVSSIATHADHTLAFGYLKRGHVLMPGAERCGTVHRIDIGLPDTTTSSLPPSQHARSRPVSGVEAASTSTLPWVVENEPKLWCDHIPKFRRSDHKYRRGQACIISGGEAGLMLGATQLASSAALRSGCGLVTLAVPLGVIAYQSHNAADILLRAFHSDGTDRKDPALNDPTESQTLQVRNPESNLPSEPWFAIAQDPRIDAILYGPGAGRSTKTRNRTQDILRYANRVVLDADALSTWQDHLEDWFEALAQHQKRVPAERCAVLTPHFGEFRRIFPPSIVHNAEKGSASDAEPSAMGADTDLPDKIEYTRIAARRSGTVVVHKGPDTVIAAPDGRCSVQRDAPKELALAGSGDILAGYLVGLCARGMPSFEAACAAVYTHARSLVPHEELNQGRVPSEWGAAPDAGHASRTPQSLIATSTQSILQGLAPI